MLRVRPLAPTRGPEERAAGPSGLCGKNLLSPSPGWKCHLYLLIWPSARPWLLLWGTPRCPLRVRRGWWLLSCPVGEKSHLPFHLSHLRPRTGDSRKNARRGDEAGWLCHRSLCHPERLLSLYPAFPGCACARLLPGDPAPSPVSGTHSSEPDLTSSPLGLWVHIDPGLNLND